MQAVEAVSEYTYWALYCRGEGCLSSVETYLPGNVLQECRLLKWCRNLTAGHGVAGVQAAEAVLEPSCWAL